MEGQVSRVGALVSNEAIDGDKLDKTVQDYTSLYDESNGEEAGVQKRKAQYTSMVNSFYDLVTNFYEFGWGHSFHFAPRHKLETFASSIARHECWLATQCGMVKGKTALDVGCGVGGPQRTIARFSEANVVGLNNNAYQIERAKLLTKEQGLSHLCSYLKADFMKIPVADNTYDAVYQIEATCHAPDKVGIYKEIMRVLKPGALFGGYEWVITDLFDENNPEHVRIKKGIEVGNGLPDLEKPSVLRQAFLDAGFEIVRDVDLAPHNEEFDVPWYEPLAGSFSISGFKHHWVGRYLTNRFVSVLESCRIAPKGTTAVSNMLMATADDLVDGGKQGIFSPMHFFLVRKPLE